MLLLVSVLFSGSAAAQKAPLPDRLEGLDVEIQQVMDDWSVPGLAIAVVTDSSVVWSRGFGERNVEAGTPVTDRTLFAIGSTTKAFTAAGLGILHDEGQLDWKTPVQEYLPRFKLHDEFATEEMTPVDLLTHRSGLPRHDLLWYATDYSRESLFERLRHQLHQRIGDDAFQSFVAALQRDDVGTLGGMVATLETVTSAETAQWFEAKL